MPGLHAQLKGRDRQRGGGGHVLGDGGLTGGWWDQHAATAGPPPPSLLLVRCLLHGSLAGGDAGKGGVLNAEHTVQHILDCRGGRVGMGVVCVCARMVVVGWGGGVVQA